MNRRQLLAPTPVLATLIAACGGCLATPAAPVAIGAPSARADVFHHAFNLNQRCQRNI